jgi:hypothetical protein
MAIQGLLVLIVSIEQEQSEKNNLNQYMKKLFLFLFCSLQFIGDISSQNLNAKKDSNESKRLEYMYQNIQNSKKFLNILDSNKEAKDEYLLGLSHLEKGRKHLGKALIGIGAFAILSSVSINNENEPIGIASVGGLGVALYYDISSVIHSVKAMKHFKKAYKLAGMSPPGLNGFKSKKLNQND